jgi:peptidoglycan/LPS O-acetylase OafA/YrhL
MTERFTYIDALRGLAILGAIAIHASQHSPPFTNYVNTLVQQGKYGVQLFYIISAFTLFLSLSRRRSTELNPVRNFSIRRLFRIAPLFWCAICFYLLRDGFGPRYWLGDDRLVTPFNLIATATFTNGWHPFWINSIVPGGWSVAIEMSFYLLIPYLYRRIKSLETACLFTSIAIISSTIVLKLGQGITICTDKTVWENFLYFWLPNQLPIFGLGLVLFFASDRLKAKLLYLKNRQLLARSIWIFCTLSIGGLSLIPANYLGGLLPIHFLYGLVFLGLAIGLQIYPDRLLVNRFTIYLGKISYSAYLTHFAVLPLVQKAIDRLIDRLNWSLPATIQYLMTLAMVICGTIILASITYRLIELPGQNLGRQLIFRLENDRHQSIK